MKREALRERMELLEIGEAMGYPRLGYGRSTKIPHDKRIPRGKAGWEKFCAHAHVDRVLPALRIGRVLREHGVTMYNPLDPPVVVMRADPSVVTVRFNNDPDGKYDFELGDILDEAPRTEEHADANPEDLIAGIDD